MGDRLEKYIRKHRDQLDFKEPRKDLWEDIAQQLSKHDKVEQPSRSFILWRAAAVILLVVSSWLAFDKVSQYMKGDVPVNIAEISPELQEVESFYVTLIEQKSEEIDVLSRKYGLEEEFHADIELLDSLYVTLKNDLKFGNEEVLIDAMILNLQMRIEILNTQLSIIQSIEKRQKDEATML
jgi:hypothetical protein